MGLEPVAWFHSWAAAGCDPSRMGIGPVPAVERLFARNGLGWADIDLIELNEAFAPQVLAVLKGWGVDAGRRAPQSQWFGHQPGPPDRRDRRAHHCDAAGEMGRRGSRYGLETMCIGGGQGIAAVFERA